MEIKLIIAVIAVAIGIFSYFPYLFDVYKGKTRPHTFSWLIWTVLTFIAYFAQISDGGGIGAWATGVSGIMMFSIFVSSIFKGEKEITISDKFSLGAALVAILIWYLTSTPLFSLILVVGIDLLGFYPTFRKSFAKPHQETITTYLLTSVKYVLGIIALENYTLVTVLFPLYDAIVNISLVILLLFFRRKFRNKLDINTIP